MLEKEFIFSRAVGAQQFTKTELLLQFLLNIYFTIKDLSRRTAFGGCF